jgi:predicted short-subunit dehydrogenase-like oxidoreductase (DUF2520 family)
MKLRSFAVVGPGRIGTTLAVLWQRSGLECLGFHGRRPAPVRRALVLVGRGSKLTLAALQQADLVLCAVPDAALPVVVTDALAAGGVRRGSLWIHASGHAAARILAPVGTAGGRYGSLHPLCPVPTVAVGVERLPGGVCAIEGPRASQPILRKLAKRLGTQPMVVAAARKSLYHAAAVLGSNQVVTLLAVAQSVFARAVGAVPRRVVAEFARNALEQYERLGSQRALTGPLVRGEVELVAAHLQALQRSVPSAVAVYQALSAAALPLAAVRGKVSASDCRRLRQLLERRPSRGKQRG